ncbi:MAG: type II toxin-antitoxin system RelE/ParE family toxin [Deltaproteobacteria bacterium]|nr:MAG: type II toxin-antitoxin system RelE/ParE family toxin [Deltaproteobacteria bacterium]
MKKYKITIQKEAIDELDEIYDFICKDSPKKAVKLVGEVKKKLLSLENFPDRGSRVKLPKLSQPIRFITHKGFVFFYTITENVVCLLHITSKGQDWWELFGL